MLIKIIIRAALLNVIVFHSCAMDKPIVTNPTQKLYLTKYNAIVVPTQIVGLFANVKVQTDVEFPPSSTKEDIVAFLGAKGQTIHEKEHRIINAYCKTKELARFTPALKILLNIHPTAFYINTVKNKLILRKEWYKCKLSDNRPVYLETRVECLYNPETDTITPEPLMLYIFPQDQPQKYVSVSMERLRSIFPEPNTLKITQKNQAQKKQESRDLAMANIRACIEHGRAPESPDPEAFYDKLYFEDLKTMAAHFLDTQDILAID